MQKRYGATPEEWEHFALTLELMEELLPVVSNQNATIASKSSLKGLGKTPSSYNKQRLVVGFAKWPQYIATPADMEKWRAESDYGISVNCRTIRAFDIDIADPDKAAIVRGAIFIHTGFALPERFRSNSGKCLLAFRLRGEHKKHRIETADGAIEFLGDGQQFVACGTHPSGERYQWRDGLPDEIPELEPEMVDATWGELEKLFAVEKPKVQPDYASVGNNGAASEWSEQEVLRMLAVLDPDMEYDDWRNVGMALQSGGFPLSMWRDWSVGGAKYQDGDCEKRWGGFNAYDGITMGTLVYMARAHGWRPTADNTIESVEGKTIHAPILQGLPVPVRNWIVDGWILSSCVTALYGDGGVGKSLLAMMLLTCVSRGVPFLGLKTEKMKAIGFFCEDTEDELHRRQYDINSHYFINFSDLESMYWQSRVGCDNVLMDFLRDGKGNPTAAYDALRKEVRRTGAQFVVIDTAADTFGGNENIRPQVRQFINLLGKLALEINGAVLLCAHPSAAGIARNDGTGGSTAWNNTVRSRLYLNRPIAINGEVMSEQDAKNLRILTKMKSNYSTVGDAITLRWSAGAFCIEDGSAMDDVSRKKRDKEDNQIFLTLLDQLTKQGRTTSESKQAANFAPRVMVSIEQGKAIGMKRLSEAMARLFETGIIERGVVGMGTDRKKREGVRRCSKDCRTVQGSSR